MKRILSYITAAITIPAAALWLSCSSTLPDYARTVNYQGKPLLCTSATASTAPEAITGAESRLKGLTGQPIEDPYRRLKAVEGFVD